MSANLLKPNDYYTIYCKNVVASDTPITSSETWCYYPSNGAAQGQVINNPVGATRYAITYNQSAISKNVVVNNDGSIDIVQSGIYRLEVQYNMTFSGPTDTSPCTVGSFVIRNAEPSPLYTSPSLEVSKTFGPVFCYYSMFFTINQGNTAPVKISTFLSPTNTPLAGNFNILGAGLSLQRIDEAPALP